jgi:hypothetical protein
MQHSFDAEKALRSVSCCPSLLERLWISVRGDYAYYATTSAIQLTVKQLRPASTPPVLRLCPLPEGFRPRIREHMQHPLDLSV